MKLIRQTLALSIWLLCYLPTTVLVLLVMLNVVAQKRREIHAPNIAG